ncbi:MAG: DUF2867 domain-containing protein [Ignavibacteria bacterium]|jgi:hypothetical protein|nr:DUF2867 domain-containing protein [Ignavibacteria bacterium]
MKKIISVKEPPHNPILVKDFGKVDHIDSYRITQTTTETAEQLEAKFLNMPKWVEFLMKLRDSIVGVFGLKTAKDALQNENSLFPLIWKNQDEIVSGAEDSHLNFRFSILIDKENSYIYITTIVHYNNRMGVLYFNIIRPFHKLIVKNMIKSRLIKI